MAHLLGLKAETFMDNFEKSNSIMTFFVTNARLKLQHSSAVLRIAALSRNMRSQIEPKTLRILHDYDLLYTCFVPTAVYINHPTFFVVKSPEPTDDCAVMCTITNPSGVKIETIMVPMVNGVSKVSYVPLEEGKHTLDISYDEVPVPGSPFTVDVKSEYFDPSEGIEFNFTEEELSDSSN